MPPVRRLTAILAADVAGYSRLMGVDEEGTHERLRVHLGALVNPKIAEHRGRVVKNTGDGLLAEFANVIDACPVRAVEVQRPGIAERAVMDDDEAWEAALGTLPEFRPNAAGRIARSRAGSGPIWGRTRDRGAGVVSPTGMKSAYGRRTPPTWL